MKETEMKAMEIIANVGCSRSYYINAIDLASDGKFEEAAACIKSGEKAFTEGHRHHAELMSMMTGDDSEMTLLLTHAEDQLMSAEGFGILAERFIKLYQKMEK